MTGRKGRSGAYKVSKCVGRIEMVVYGISAILSFGMLIPGFDSFIGTIAALQAFAIAVYVIFGVVDDSSCWYRANRETRAGAFKHGMGVDITDYECPRGYYTNSFSPSVAKYVVSLFESLYFTRAISHSMIAKRSVVALFPTVMLVVVFSAIGSNPALPLAAQAVFSTYCIIPLVGTAIFFNRVDSIFYELYRLLVAEGIDTREQLAAAVFLAQEYEVAKAHYKVRLSEKVFENQNGDLSKEWSEISEKIRISCDQL